MYGTFEKLRLFVDVFDKHKNKRLPPLPLPPPPKKMQDRYFEQALFALYQRIKIQFKQATYIYLRAMLFSITRSPPPGRPTGK